MRAYADAGLAHPNPWRARFSATWRDPLPPPRQLPKRLLAVQRSWIEIRPVRPHQCLDLRIDPHLIEQLQIAQRPIQLAGKNRPKIDRLFGAVLKTNTERVRTNNLEVPDAMNRMTHNRLLQRL